MVFKTFENGTFSTGLLVHPIECLGNFSNRFFVGKKSPCRIDHGVLQILFSNGMQSAGAAFPWSGKTGVVVMLGSRMARAADADHLLFAVAADEFAGENEFVNVFLLSGKVLVCIADRLNGLPCAFIDQLRIDVGIDGIAVPDFSGIFCVAQHSVDLFVDEIFSFFGTDTARFQVVCDFDDGISLRKFRKYLFDDGPFLFVDDNFLIDNVETIQKDPARIIAFQIAFPHPSEYLLRKLGGIILVHAFQEAFQDDAFGTVGDIFHCRHELHAVFFERVFMDRRFILITRKSIKFVNCHMFLWTVFNWFYKRDTNTRIY